MTVTAALLCATLTACGANPTTPEEAPSTVVEADLVRYQLLGPPNGTAVRRGQPLEVRVIVHDAPEPVVVWLALSVDFLHPGGTRPDTSYLPGFEPTIQSGPLPATLVARLVIPAGTPEGNPGIPPGSRVTALRVTLYNTARSGTRGPGVIATYPLID